MPYYMYIIVHVRTAQVCQQVDMCSTMSSFSACTIMPLQELNLHALAGTAAPVIHSLSSLSFPVLPLSIHALFRSPSLSLSLLPSTFLSPSVYPCSLPLSFLSLSLSPFLLLLHVSACLCVLQVIPVMLFSSGCHGYVTRAIGRLLSSGHVLFLNVYTCTSSVTSLQSASSMPYTHTPYATHTYPNPYTCTQTWQAFDTARHNPMWSTLHVFCT